MKNAAANATRCTGLTASELAAMVLAPTWPEVTGGANRTPSPMTRWFIDPTKAEGYTASWQQDPKDGNDRISPLAYAFYNFWDSTEALEHRHWLQADTGYWRGEVLATRASGDDPRTSGALRWTDADVLCDSDFSKGTC